MKPITALNTLILQALLLCGCESALDEKLQGEWEDRDIWRIPQMAEGVLMNAYTDIPAYPDNGSVFPDAATDNALTNDYSSGPHRAAMGEITPMYNPFGNWQTCYEKFQYIHRFLENGLTENTVYNRIDPEIDLRIKRRLAGEAFFLRAWWGFQLLGQYGGKTAAGEALGYPIVTKFIPEEEAAANRFRRNSYAECAARIFADCHRAMELLPGTYAGDDPVVGISDIGRASSQAAAVLKSRIALYAASPAYQPDDITRIEGMGSFTVTDAAAYTRKWIYAAQVADSILRTPAFANFEPLAATDLADVPNATPGQLVFRQHSNYRGMEARHFPPSYYGAARTVPSQNLVDAFPALNGYPADDPRAGIGQDPYARRDKRLDLNVYYQGRTFGKTGEPIDVAPGGRDAADFHADASRTGYYLAKHLSSKSDMLLPTALTNATHYNPLLRKAEVFLNFAEAANEAWGPKSAPACKYTAYEVIKMVRELSGGITDEAYIDETAASRETFRKLIQNERRIEFAFEGHRYFDMRRWLLRLDEPVRGVVVTRTDAGFTFETHDVEPRKFDHIRFYYAPIPYEEIVKNPSLANNAGWQ